MKKYAFISDPSIGSMWPMLPVVRELKSRGEDVVFICMPEFEQRTGATGARTRSYQFDFSAVPPEARTRTYLEECIPVILPQLEKILLEEKPDVIVYSWFSPPAHVAPLAVKIPAIQWRAMPASNEHFNILQYEKELTQEIELGASDVGPEPFDVMVTKLNEARAKYGAAPLKCSVPVERPAVGSFFESAEDKNVIFIPRSAQPRGETFDERFVFVGPYIEENPAPNPLADKLIRHMQDGPALYASIGMGSANPKFYNACFEAFAGTDWRVVVSTGLLSGEDVVGKTSISDAIRKAPDNFAVEPWVPQLEILPHTDIFMTHGGCASDALYFGVPMVFVPQEIEEALVSRHLAELGAGRLLKQVSADNIRDAVNTVHTNPSFRATVRELQRETQAAGGTRAAADAIQAFARERS